jgi:hypothetical protein
VNYAPATEILYRHRHCSVVTVQYFRSVSVSLQRRSPHPTFIRLHRSSSRVGREQRDARTHHGDGLFHSFFRSRLGPGRCNLGSKLELKLLNVEPLLPVDVALG